MHTILCILIEISVKIRMAKKMRAVICLVQRMVNSILIRAGSTVNIIANFCLLKKMLRSAYKWPNHSNHDLFAFQAHRPAHLIKKNCIQTRNRKNKKEVAGVQKALLEQLPPMLI